MGEVLLASDLLKQHEKRNHPSTLVGAATGSNPLEKLFEVVNFRLTRALLQAISRLDDVGAWEWSLWHVAVATAVLLGAVRWIGKKKWGIDWYALVHALLSASGSVMVVYLDYAQSQALTGYSEPLRSCLCQGPLTSLHRILPAITMGYSLYDFLDGLRIGVDFAAHGAATLAILAFFCALEAPQFIAPLLIMEVSTVFLVLVPAHFFTETLSLFNQACFVVAFFLCRCVAAPYVHFQIIWTMIQEPAWRSCYPWYLLPVSAVFGCFFHALNSFWMYKIVRKVRRKLRGEEGIRANNDISKPENHHVDSPNAKKAK